jgi:gas vesicle protein
MLSSEAVIGVVIGGAVGTVLGILVAPANGSVTRMNTAREGAAYPEVGKENLNDYVDPLTEEYNTGTEGALLWFDRGENSVASFEGTRGLL